MSGQTPTHLPTPRHATEPAATQAVKGVLFARLGAWIVDALLIVVFAWLLTIVITIIGLATLGAGWMLLPAVGLIAALSYAALTIGGPRQATPGMRMAGIKVMRADGGRPDGLAAAAHALLFWVAAGTGVLLALTIAIGLMRADRRLGHDLLTGLVLVRA